MKRKSDIASALVKAGLRKGSKQYKAAYLKEWHARNREKRKAYLRRWRNTEKGKAWQKRAFARYYRKKQKEDPTWNARRNLAWRSKNPAKYQAIKKRCIQNGLFKRFYQRHKERILANARARAKERNPLYGLTKKRQLAAQGKYPLDAYLRELGDALVRVKQGSHKKRGDS